MKNEDYISLTDIVRDVDNGLALIEKWENPGLFHFIMKIIIIGHFVSSLFCYILHSRRFRQKIIF